MISLKKIFIDEQPREAGTHFPSFVIIVTIVQIALFIYIIVYNKGLTSMYENPMAGPSSLTSTRNGAKFVPCMKPTQEDDLRTITACPSDISFTNKTCTYEEYLWYVCNTNNLKGFPYQVYRLFIPIFLHAGIIHLVLNLVNQLAIGIMLEHKFNSIRISIIYILSGIGGTLLSAIGLPQYFNVGASGALYGLLAVYFMDTIRNWENLQKPWLILTFQGIFIIASLIIGIFIPIVDYMAHIGGFLLGILSGLVICPNLYWNICKYDSPIQPKLIIMAISSMFIIAFFLGGFIGFFRTTAPVYWLK
ncbi:unnamed protein product [Adineta ricciae]|uniref:rhomboid protease n=1 Tax=Adineta ricciae TaxID=249248 RepID=A0A813V0C3_ADIRI|nr:unnamed protein product [Adineta ricciae]